MGNIRSMMQVNDYFTCHVLCAKQVKNSKLCASLESPKERK